jgi:hypothetical protein
LRRIHTEVFGGGLEQSFNSLEAQREACIAYIQSQKHEGWTALNEMYDDGGFSGGTMERPALKQLLADTLESIRNSGWEEIFGAVSKSSSVTIAEKAYRAATSVAVPNKPWCDNA